MTRRMQHLLADNFPYLAAESAGVLCGYAYAGPYRARPAYRWTLEDSVYIAPEMQRRGIGHALLAALIEMTRTLGFRQMIAVIGDSTKQAASIGLHEALGFRHVGILHDVGFKQGRWLDTVLMQLTLGDGSTTMPRIVNED
jgi:phosphinothricin acetyltransferase